MTTDLYAIAEEMQHAAKRRYRDVYFEERKDGGLVFDTYPAKLIVTPLRRGGYLVEFVWSYRTQWDETESVEIEMGEYKTAQGAVKRAMELALWPEQDIKAQFDWYARIEQGFGSTEPLPAPPGKLPFFVRLYARGSHLPHGWHESVKGEYATEEEAHAALAELFPAYVVEGYIYQWYLKPNGQWRFRKIASRQRQRRKGST